VRWLDFLRGGDLLIANDAATVPASIAGIHLRTGEPIELRLAAWRGPASAMPATFDAIVFGEGDYRTRTEDRPAPPTLIAGDRLAFGALMASVIAPVDHPRLVRVRFDASGAAFWRALAQQGRPVQYAHIAQPLALWDVWTSIAATPVAFEPPSAGFFVGWRDVSDMRARGIAFATLTHAAGLSSTGDAALDARFPLAEWYRIPARTIDAIERARLRCGRIIAVGTTVVRAIEDAARRPLRGGTIERRATLRIDAATSLRIVDAIITGTHEPGSSHYALLRAFATADTLAETTRTLERERFLTHEFGDSLLIFADSRSRPNGAETPAPIACAA
jgi:S-adenosylmethionine:tRNA ribosyltransferase-isomerase